MSPAEIRSQVLSFCRAVPDLIRCSGVCRAWRLLAQTVSVNELSFSVCPRVSASQALAVCQRWRSAHTLVLSGCSRASSPSSLQAMIEALSSVETALFVDCQLRDAGVHRLLELHAASIQTLDVSKNAHITSLFASLPARSLPRLQTLSANACPYLWSTRDFSAALCPEALQSLELSGATALHESAIQRLPSLVQLRRLCLARCPCHDDVVEAVLVNCVLLEHLDLSGTRLQSIACTGSIPSVHCLLVYLLILTAVRLPNLRFLCLNRCSIRRLTIMACSLRQLHVAWCPLDRGDLYSVVLQSAALQLLDLRGTLIEDADLDAFVKHAPKAYIDVDSCRSLSRTLRRQHMRKTQQIYSL